MYYAELRDKGIFHLCFSFDSKKLRDEWVKRQNQKSLKSYNQLKKEMNLSPASESCFPEYHDEFFAINSKEARKHFPYIRYGKRTIRIHSHITNIDDKW